MTECLQKSMPKPVVCFKLQLRCRDREWSLEKTFGEFETLHNELRKNFMIVPTLPPKALPKLLTPEVFAKRAQDFQEYLKALLGRVEVLNHALTRAFLQVRFGSQLSVA